MNGQEGTMASPQPPYAGPAPLTVKLASDAVRVDVDALMNEFREELGPARWEKYRDTLTHFLMGKLSRAELVRCLRENVGAHSSVVKNHNALVLSLLANACRHTPGGTESASADWKSTTRSRARLGMDAGDDRLHREVLSLPARERRRIKAIAKEAQAQAKQPLVAPPPPVLVATRHAMLPHIPFLPDAKEARAKLAGKGARGGAPSSANGEAGAKQAGPGAPAAPGSTGTKDPTPGQALMDPLLNLNPGRTSGPLTWTQDIIQGLETPSIAETHEFPDDSAMGTRMLGVALEHGLLEGIGAGATDIMLLGLESYLRNIVDQLVELKHRRFSSQEPLTAEDLDLLVSMRPAEIGEHMAPVLRLRSHFLRDEPTVEPVDTQPAPSATPAPALSTTPSSAPAPAPAKAKKRVSPWDLCYQKRAKHERDNTDTPEEAERKARLLREHEQGIALVGDLAG